MDGDACLTLRPLPPPSQCDRYSPSCSQLRIRVANRFFSPPAAFYYLFLVRVSTRAPSPNRGSVRDSGNWSPPPWCLTLIFRPCTTNRSRANPSIVRVDSRITSGPDGLAHSRCPTSWILLNYGLSRLQWCVNARLRLGTRFDSYFSLQSVVTPVPHVLKINSREDLQPVFAFRPCVGCSDVSFLVERYTLSTRLPRFFQPSWLLILIHAFPQDLRGRLVRLCHQNWVAECRSWITLPSLIPSDAASTQKSLHFKTSPLTNKKSL